MKDRFSGYAPQYAAFRPHYPQALFNFIFQHVQSFDLAWDAGTGNGQAAAVLATRFRKVYATDISQKQLDSALRLPSIEYAVAGETTALASGSIDLITVAQAVHWFDREIFLKEVKRVSRPGATVAIWGYGLLKISDAIDPLISHFYTSVVGPYWDPERKLIDQQYSTIDFPFHEVPTPEFAMHFKWTLAELEGYLSTWSAVQNFIKKEGKNPVSILVEILRPQWKGATMAIRFPLFLRLGMV